MHQRFKTEGQSTCDFFFAKRSRLDPDDYRSLCKTSFFVEINMIS